VIAPDQRAFFTQCGYLPLGRVATRAETLALRAEATRFLNSAPDDHLVRSDGHVRVGLHLCHLNQAFRAHAISVAPTAAALLGKPAQILTSLLFNKPPQIGQALELHQDLPYYPYLGDSDLITCWLALDDTDESNGCIEYLPGSHHVRIPHRATVTQQALDIEPSVIDAGRLKAVTLAAGEAVAHHGLAVHRSGANHSTRPRMGLSTLFVPARVAVSVEDSGYKPIEV
jgi:ectoine hydroxylase-related dioxygenase (phytanoyl-CoA dioxygenase family)